MGQYDYDIQKALESMATSLEKIERNLAMIQTGMVNTKPVERDDKNTTNHYHVHWDNSI